MPADESQRAENDRSLSSAKRRRVLSTLGALSVSALAGCASNDAASEATPTPDGDSGSIDPRFGYIDTGDGDAPVEADHTVEMIIAPREGAEIPYFYFEPTGLSIEPGDTVRFNLASPHHNINGYHPAFGYTQRVPENAPPYSSPVLSVGESWLYTFETEGVHNIMCAPHEIFGMVGAIVVGSATGPGANPVGEAPAPTEESRSPPFTAATVLQDPAMDPENIVEQGSVSWDEIADENKRLLIAPVEE